MWLSGRRAAGERSIMTGGEHEATHEYSKDGVTVLWKPGLCMHSAKCVLGLGSVFNLQARPWINMDAAATDRIVEQVKQCPSGALSYRNS
jgi:uncharacterized Fe-S cluster protein YjdI